MSRGIRPHETHRGDGNKVEAERVGSEEGGYEIDERWMLFISPWAAHHANPPNTTSTCQGRLKSAWSPMPQIRNEALDLLVLIIIKLLIKFIKNKPKNYCCLNLSRSFNFFKKLFYAFKKSREKLKMYWKFHKNNFEWFKGI